jgi:hypothetical protein
LIDLQRIVSYPEDVALYFYKVFQMCKFIIHSVLLVVALFACSLQAKSNVNLSYYLAAVQTESKSEPELILSADQYNEKIPTPESVLGFQVGDWHARPEQIERYFQVLAASSPRIKLHTYAYTHEKRPLFLAYISSEENITNLDSLQKQHLLMKKKTSRPAVTWMGYSVHGNEASGSNASLLLAYHLIAAKDEQTAAQLKDQIIIIDPMLNPDGLARFAHWANMYKSKKPNSDANTREHNEAWPNGRTNHYWFDLNRDWLLLQHPESQGRVKMFHQWMPNVLTDFHEMGTNSTYFFQPGVESRQNPLTSQENFDITAKIATYHAKALDKIGSLYYSKESFDDFYYGKGSTYPDINGGIGILFEQASARGHLQESVNGDVSFPFAIKNHLTTSLSTLKAVQENRKLLLNYQRRFYQKAKLKAKSAKDRAIIYQSTDKYRLNEFNKVLSGHQIKFSKLAKNIKLDGQFFKPGQSFIIPLQQSQYSLINSIFEKRINFEDNTFYDVSSWTLPLAFDIDYAMISRSDFDSDLFEKSGSAKETTNNSNTVIFESIQDSTIALAFDWRNFASANLLAYCHQQKIKVRMANKTLQVKTNKGFKNIQKGDLVIPMKSQQYSSTELFDLLQKKITELNIMPLEILTGLSLTGPDLGSPSMPSLKPINPVMLVGDKVNSYQAGEVWHLLDQRLEQSLTMMTAEDFFEINANQYTHLILVDGQYKFSNLQTKTIKKWVKDGGILMTQSKASSWVSKQGWLSSKGVKLEVEANTFLNYSDMASDDSKNYIGGAITSTKIDLSHPLAYGLSDENLAVFKRGQFSFTEPKESFVSVARFNKKPLLAGYMSKENQKNLSGKSSILIQKLGEGKIIAFSDDMNFRGFWLGTSKVFTNALYFGDVIRAVPKKKIKASAL